LQKGEASRHIADRSPLGGILTPIRSQEIRYGKTLVGVCFSAMLVLLIAPLRRYNVIPLLPLRLMVI
jgi:hypothetical protein